MASKQHFVFDICYFKPNGKYYTSHSFAILAENCGSLEHPTARMQDVVDYIKYIQESKVTALPGLSSHQWDGPILLDCEEGFPILILPGN